MEYKAGDDAVVEYMEALNNLLSSDSNKYNSKKWWSRGVVELLLPMHWSSKMQTEIALSTTEAEYIALSQAMREVLPIIWLFLWWEGSSNERNS